MRRLAVVMIVAAVTLGLATVTAPPAAADARHGGGFHGGPGFHGGSRGHEFHEFHRHRFFGGPVFVGPTFGWDPFWYAPAYPDYTYSAPQIYVQPAPPTYWYYCPDAGAYYPYVQQCPSGWLTVVPR